MIKKIIKRILFLAKTIGYTGTPIGIFLMLKSINIITFLCLCEYNPPHVFAVTVILMSVHTFVVYKIMNFMYLMTDIIKVSIVVTNTSSNSINFSIPNRSTIDSRLKPYELEVTDNESFAPCAAEQSLKPFSSKKYHFCDYVTAFSDEGKHKMIYSIIAYIEFVLEQHPGLSIYLEYTVGHSRKGSIGCSVIKHYLLPKYFPLSRKSLEYNARYL